MLEEWKAIRAKLESEKEPKSAWRRGVRSYAEWILSQVIDKWGEYPSEYALRCDFEVSEKFALNGVKDWKQASWDGNFECYDEDIAKRLCMPCELKVTRNGRRKPNKNEDWLDVQARALQQAWWLIEKTAKEIGIEVK